MKMLLKLTVSFLFILNSILSENVDASQPLVKIGSGSIRGYTDNSTNGKIYYVFNGIPYAKSPKRFKPTEPVEPWAEVLDANKDGHSCSQINAVTNVYEGSEDCLTLNVYTPQLQDDKQSLLPVIVNIHEGGFIAGTGAKLFRGPQNLMDYPVVLVTFNYRLGVLGFLSTGDESAFGNYGMMDQVMALKWVQANIETFGGDPKRVTIFGVSAGAASVMFHILSPLSSGLFHAAIIGSGSALNPWAVKENPKDLAVKLAKGFMCDNPENSNDIIQCLSKKTAEELVLGARKLRKNIYFPTDLAPVIEPEGGPGFLTENPLTLLKEGKIANKVPVILGLTKFEGYFIYIALSSVFKSTGKAFFDKEFLSEAYLFSSLKPNDTLAVKRVIKEYVHKAKGVEDKTKFIDLLSTIIGDATFGAGISQSAELLSKAGVPTYAYVYNHMGDHCTVEFMGGKCGKYVSHGDDLFLNFRIANLGLSEKDAKMAQIINGLWTDFASGKMLQINDGEKWPLYDVHNHHYLEVSLKPSIKPGNLSDKMTFWTKTIPKLLHLN
ncbi:hypothetical protein CHUAL_006778 [Chamberlinius hualienensis]